VAIKRLALRSKTDKSRLYDMSTELIVERLEEYKNKTKLARDYYEKKGLLRVVDGEGSVDEVFERICIELDKAQRLVF